jgi:hypothetical protein
MFNTLPARTAGDRIAKEDVAGHVLVIEPKEYVASIQTSNGESDAIRLDIHDITDKQTYEEVLWFGAIVGSFKNAVGNRLLVRIKRGEAKPGKSAPWIAEDLTGNEKAVLAATKYMSERGTPASAPTKKTNDAEVEAALDNLDDLL